MASSRRATSLRSPGLGAVVAQVWQAGGSFGLQVLAAWMLGAAGLGLLSLCLGLIVAATAIASGMVGDSLVILNRHDPGVRGGLQVWAVALGGSAAVLVAVALAAFGLLTGWEATLFAAALAAFALEELVRRLLMANMRFWRLVLIDSTSVLSTIAVVAVWALNARVTISTFFLGIVVGQLAGIAIGLAMLPATERIVAPLRGAAVKKVATFGAWRGAQVSISPLVVTATRIAVTAAVGQAVLGELEAARILMAPALLAVQGLGSYLLSTYVRDRQAPLASLIRRAWRFALLMMAAAVICGALLTAIGPLLAPFVTGPDISVDRWAIAGWALFVAASASCQPFASLAAARGGQVGVFVCRSVDAALAMTLLWVLLIPLEASASWTPFVLAAGLFLGGAFIRQFVIPSITPRHTEDSSEVGQLRTSHVAR